jgi:D-glycero-D-manno-heptose 1,7-bisphosphate phosphatase
MQCHGIPIAASYFCPHTPEDCCQCRKPSPFLLERAAREHSLDFHASFMIGDRERRHSLR